MPLWPTASGEAAISVSVSFTNVRCRSRRRRVRLIESGPSLSPPSQLADASRRLCGQTDHRRPGRRSDTGEASQLQTFWYMQVAALSAARLEEVGRRYRFLYLIKPGNYVPGLSILLPNRGITPSWLSAT